jgi:bile acid:Na+ symporter, BASS family
MHETLLDAFKTVVSVVIPLAALATGLRASTVDPLWLFKRPALLLRSLLAILVLVPMGTLIFLEAVAPPTLVEGGLLVAILAVGIGPPAAFSHTRAAEEHVVAYEVELNVVLLLLSIIFIPAAVAFLGAYFNLQLRLDPSRVAAVVFTRALVPLLAGVLIARLFPRAIAPLGRVVGPIIQISLLLVVVVALVAFWRGLVGLGGQAWLLCAAVAMGALCVGHLCGGPERSERRVLATFSSTRFPALALLIASVAPRGKQLIPVVLAYVISSLVCGILYGLVMSRRERSAPAPMPLAPISGRA